MAKTLAAIQKNARFSAKNEQLVITNGHGLTAFNSIYRSVANSLPWPELRVTSTSSTVTVSAQSTAYAWIAATTAVFIDVKAVEVETTASSSVFNLLVSPPTESEWSEAAKDTDSMPAYYLRYRSGASNLLEIRPAPSAAVAGGSINITGIIEPTELSLESSTTVFLASTADDVLAYLVAADDLMTRGKTTEANNLFEKATKILRKIFNDELVPDELVREMVN
jgi:hypothetical protein